MRIPKNRANIFENSGRVWISPGAVVLSPSEAVLPHPVPRLSVVGSKCPWHPWVLGVMSLSKMEGLVDVSLGGRIPRLKPIV